MLSSESNPTMSMVVPTLKILMRTLDEVQSPDGEPLTKCVGRLREAMKSDLKQRTDKNMPTYELASALDPRTKSMILNDCPDIKQRVLEEAKKVEFKIKVEPVEGN